LETYKNIGLTVTVLTGLVLLAAKLNGEKLETKNFLAIGILAIACLIMPFPAMIFAIPVGLVAYFRYQDDVWELWYSLKNKGLN